MSAGGKRVRVVTMGCSKNRVDSEHLLMQLAESSGVSMSWAVCRRDTGMSCRLRFRK